MELMEAIKNRHSVRSYTDKEINGSVKTELLSCIEQCNKESGLYIQLILNEPKAFDGFMAHYGKFSGVRNYIALIGKKEALLEENAGIMAKKSY